MTSILLFISNLIDWFIPAEIAANRESRKQARMFLISHLFGPFIGNTVPLALYIFDPNPGWQVAVLAISITGFWIFPFILRAFGHYDVLALVSIQNLMFCIFWSCFFYGGVTSPTLPWVLSIPLLAFFYIGSAPRLRNIFIAMFTVNFAIFCLFTLAGYAPRPALDSSAVQGLGLVSTIAASLYVAMMALFYAKVLASQSELEVEMRQHLDTAAELRRMTEEAESASRAKAEFLARMSHELRTPLNAVIGFSQMLLEVAEEEEDDETASDLERIHGAGQQLLRLVDEVLDLSRIEANKLEVYCEATDIGQLAAGILDRYREPAQKNGNTIELCVQPDVAGIVCDRMKVERALAQLVDNASKYTQDGSVEVRIQAEGEAGQRRLSIRVKDTGVGIAAHLVPQLFDQFSVASDTSGTKYGGTGLGLALARKYCQLQRGDIQVSSQEGVGSEFTILLPATPDDAPVVAAQPQRPADPFGQHAPSPSAIRVAMQHSLTSGSPALAAAHG